MKYNLLKCKGFVQGELLWEVLVIFDQIDGIKRNKRKGLVIEVGKNY